MSRNTTGGTGNNGIENRVKDALRELYSPSPAIIEAKAAFHYRLANGIYKGTDESEWDITFINMVLGTNIKLSADAHAWFKSTKTIEETKLSNAALALKVLRDEMLNEDAKAGDRIKAAVESLKISGAYDKGESKDTGTGGEMTDEEIESLRKDGVDVTPFLKKVD